MISFLLINSDVENLRRLLIKYCYWYYVKAEPLINDRDYDLHFDYLKELEKTNDACFKPTPESPTQMVYGDLESQYPDWAKNKDIHTLYSPEEIAEYENKMNIPFNLHSMYFSFRN